MNRGAVKKTEARMINVWMPTALLPLIDECVVTLDIDRSKFIRSAIREKIQREKAEGNRR